MMKVTVLAHRSALGDVVAALQSAGAVEITSVGEGLQPLAITTDHDRVRELEEALADASFVRDFLGRHHTSTQPFGAFVGEKIHLSEDEYDALVADESARALYGECEDISARIATAEREIARLRDLAHELHPWEGLHLQISQWQGTPHIALLAGVVHANEGVAIRQRLRDISPHVTVEELESVGGRAAWVVMAHRSVIDEVRSALALVGFQETAFSELDDYPAEERQRALERADELEGEVAVLSERARVLAAERYAEAYARAEAIGSQLDAITVRERFGSTDRTAVISGWVKASRRDALESALAPFGDATDLTLEEPGEDDRPPVELENPRLLRPFEVLTELYGLPRYDEMDPTPLLAPFFLTFFAICVGDVGYGLMLIAGAWFIKHRIDVAPGVKKFMDLLMTGGAGAMVAGVLTGSYFALDFDSVIAPNVPFLAGLRIIDPLAELQTFLLFCIALGVAQIIFGVLVAAWDLARRGDRVGAVSEQLSTLLLFGSLAVAVLVPSFTMVAIALGVAVTAIFKGRALEVAVRKTEAPLWDRALASLWLLGLLAALTVWATGSGPALGWPLLGLTVVALAASRATRRTVVAVLGGAYAVYGMSSFLGDILSYTRLAALGLSSSLVGFVFNLMAGMVIGGAGARFAEGGIGILWGTIIVALGSLVFVFGHVFNVVINLLGAFVHPARLQFVEFFSKFYEGGGKAHRPFEKRAKSLVVHAGTVRQEGAGS